MSMRLSRDSILDGSFVRGMQAAIAQSGSRMHIRPDAEVEANRIEFLARRPRSDSLWVFTYGSLMWNPLIGYVDRQPVMLSGWHRSLCLEVDVGRGTLENKGLMLALEEGGETSGIAFRLSAEAEELETRILWRRELLSDGYVPRWVQFEVEGELHDGFTFIVNRRSQRYVPHLTEEQIVQMMSTAAGQAGSSLEYLNNSVAELQKLGLRDPQLELIAVLAAERRARQGNAATPTAEDPETRPLALPPPTLQEADASAATHCIPLQS